MNDVERCISEWVDRVNERDATIAALQARVEELEQWVQDQSTANLETMRHMDEMQSRALEAESQLTQRTAELEAAKRERDVWYARYNELSGVKDRQLSDLQAELEAAKADKAKWEDIAGLRFAGDHKFVKEMELLKVENTTLQAELERVKGELVEAKDFLNTVTNDLNETAKERDDLRTLILALPKVEGEITANRVCTIMMHGMYCEEFTKLLQHRQGMEG